MSERELLEKAAKAAGLVEHAYYADDHGKWECMAFDPGGSKSEYWNPLTDDGDALRLLIKLPFRELYVSEIGATVSWQKDDGPHRWKCDEYASENGDSLSAATRRAIVRAAASIGPTP